VDDHCDCMFLINTYRWDYPLLAALCAPRPLLLANTDTDEYFPLDGVLHTHDLVKRIYDLYGAPTNFGLVLAPGPHKDIQDVQVPVFRWFNIHLKGEDPIIDMAAVKMFQPQELKVLSDIPDDQINTQIEDSFEPEAPTPEVPASVAEWTQRKEGWMDGLREKCFAGWPTNTTGISGVKKSFLKDGVLYEEIIVRSEHDVVLPIYLMLKAGAEPRQLSLRVADESYTNVISEADGSDMGIQKISDSFGRPEFVEEMAREVKKHDKAFALFLPRGIGSLAWRGEDQEKEIRRRYMLLGQTLDGMRVWDIERAIQMLISFQETSGAQLNIQAEGGMGVNVLYASLFVPGITAPDLDLRHIPAHQVEGPDYLNVLKIMDIPEAAAMAAERCPLQLQSDDSNGWEFLRAMAASPVANLKVKWKE
jgi:hypothetical protein